MARSKTRKTSSKKAAPTTHELLQKPVISVPEAGGISGLSRNGAYEAAKRGDFDTIKMGKLILVPTAALRRKLGIEAA